MKISGFNIYTFKIPFIKIFSVQEKVIEDRRGFIISIHSLDGSQGLGEISPLPGFSTEDFDGVQQQILKFRSQILAQSIPAHCEDLSGVFESWLMQYRLFPSVRFGFETAILNLLAKQKSVGLQEFLGGPIQKEVSLIGLLEGKSVELTSQIQKMRIEGFKHFKLKVGSHNIRDEIDKVEAIQRQLTAECTLRLDANQFWSFAESVEFAQSLSQNYVEYIEEPFKNSGSDINLVEQFFVETGIPIALDETLLALSPKQLFFFAQQMEWNVASKEYAASLEIIPAKPSSDPFLGRSRIRKPKGLKALILKPTLLGGIEKAVGWIRFAKSMGIQAVLSSCFESGVGLLALAEISAALNCQPIGLDTYKYFSTDIWDPPLSIRSGKIRFPLSLENGYSLNSSVLTKLPYE